VVNTLAEKSDEIPPPPPSEWGPLGSGGGGGVLIRGFMVNDVNDECY